MGGRARARKKNDENIYGQGSADSNEIEYRLLVAVRPAVMLRHVPFLVFYILLWFSFANNAESLSTLRDECLEFDIADLEGYVSTLNLTNVPTVDTMFTGFDCPITALPFGFLRSDWARLLLLRKMLPEESILAKKLDRLIRVLIIVYQRIERGLVPNRYSNETNEGHSVSAKGFVSDTTTIVSGTDGMVNINHGDIKNALGSSTTEFNTYEVTKTGSTTENCISQGSTVTEFLDNEVGSFSTLRVNTFLGDTNVKAKTSDNSTYENQDKKIVEEAKREKDPVTSLKSSTPINFEVGSVVNSRSTVKFNRFGTSTEKFNPIDSLSTVRTRISEGTTSQKEETERTTSHTINFHDSDDGGNRNIEDDRDFAFTTSPVGSSVNTETSANGRTDFNSFDTNREKIKNDEKLKVSASTTFDTVTLLPEKSEKSGTKFSENTSTTASTSSEMNLYSPNKKVKSKESSDSPQSTASYDNIILSTNSENLLSTNKDSTSLEFVNTEESIKANVDHSLAASTEASTKSGPTRSTVRDVTNRQDLKETTSNEVSTSEKHNPGNMSSVARNSMDYLDPSSNVYDVFAHESDKLDSDIDESHRMVGNKLKKLPVFRKQPPRNIMNDYEETVQKPSSFTSKATTFSTNSMGDINGFKKTSLGSRKRANTNTNIENNFRFFYNLGGRSAVRKKAEDDLDLIRVRCKDESM